MPLRCHHHGMSGEDRLGLKGNGLADDEQCEYQHSR